ncbi:MAG: 2-dehydro-3-deoxygluconokinase [Tenericutes bacterium ADurb.Bin087]|nr:MAG: 2-dehydro-3-deoxygluconokinase [Tenericutes bacterium ADurb.Bin087]
MVAVIGEILVDIFKDGNEEIVLPGGAPFNVACNIAHFGGEVRFMGSVGTDPYGTMLKSIAESRPFKCVFIQQHEKKATTQAIVTLVNGERDFKFKRDNAADYLFDIELLKKVDFPLHTVVHLGSLMLSEKVGQDFALEVLKLVKARKLKLSFDLNYREDIFGAMNKWIPLFSKIINEAAIVKFSEEEIIAYTKEKDAESALNTFKKREQIIVVSLGNRGSMFTYNGRIIKVPTVRVEPIDTTGAGDAFYSFILYAIRHKKKWQFSHNELSNILYFANRVGAVSTLKKGAIDVVPDIKEIKAWGYHE